MPIHRITLYRWRRDGKISFIKLTSKTNPASYRVMYPKAEIDAMIAEEGRVIQ